MDALTAAVNRRGHKFPLGTPLAPLSLAQLMCLAPYSPPALPPVPCHPSLQAHPMHFEALSRSCQGGGPNVLSLQYHSGGDATIIASKAAGRCVIDALMS